MLSGGQQVLHDYAMLTNAMCTLGINIIYTSLKIACLVLTKCSLCTRRPCNRDTYLIPMCQQACALCQHHNSVVIMHMMSASFSGYHQTWLQAGMHAPTMHAAPICSQGGYCLPQSGRQHPPDHAAVVVAAHTTAVAAATVDVAIDLTAEDGPMGCVDTQVDARGSNNGIAFGSISHLRSYERIARAVISKVHSSLGRTTCRADMRHGASDLPCMPKARAPLGAGVHRPFRPPRQASAGAGQQQPAAGSQRSITDFTKYAFQRR